MLTQSGLPLRQYLGTKALSIIVWMLPLHLRALDGLTNELARLGYWETVRQDDHPRKQESSRPQGVKLNQVLGRTDCRSQSRPEAGDWAVAGIELDSGLGLLWMPENFGDGSHGEVVRALWTCQISDYIILYQTKAVLSVLWALVFKIPEELILWIPMCVPWFFQVSVYKSIWQEWCQRVLELLLALNEIMGMEQLCFLSQETIIMTVIIFSNHYCIGVLVK